MATFEQLTTAAGNAHAAGDAAAAQALVSEAKRLYPDQFGAAMSQLPQPQTAQQPIAATPPRVEAQEAQRTEGNHRGMAVNRFGDAVGPAMEAPRQALNAFVGGLADQSQSPTFNALPDTTNRHVRSGLAYAGDTLGAAASSLATGYAAVVGTAAEIIGGDTTSERKLARDLIMMGEVAAPELAGVSGAVGAGRRVAKATEKLANPTEGQLAARAADDLGITPALGMGGKARGMAAATLEKVPLSAGRIEADAVRAVEEVQSAFQRIQSNIGTGGTASEAGGTLQRGVQAFKERFQARSAELYEKVSNEIPADTRVTLSGTTGAISEAVELFRDNPKVMKTLGLTKWDTLSKDMANGMSWQATMRLRSNIGEAIGKANGPLADQQQGLLRQIYGALTSDLEAAASAAGPKASQAWSRANNYYRSGARRLTEQLDKTIKADRPEAAFEAFSNMLRRDRSSSDIQRVRSIRQSVTKDEWQEIGASIVDRLGRATDGRQNADGDAFSPQRFLTQWVGMSPEAKRLLLPEATRVELDKLARVSGMVRDAGGERNFSNTGAVTTGVVTGAGLGVAPATTISLLGGAALTSRALTSAPFLRAANRAARGDVGPLKAMANGGGPFRDDAQQVLVMMSAQNANEPANDTPRPALRIAP